MNTVVVVRQVPDLIEPLEVAPSGTELDLDAASFILNESDDHALEQALLLKEAHGGSVTVVALDFGEVDNTLYTAAAKGADRIVKIVQDGVPPPPRAAAALYAEAIKPLAADLVLVGVQAHDELDGGLSPFFAAALGSPYVGVIRGVTAGPEAGTVVACKEFPGAVMARMNVKLPAVLGILGADQPPRYVPVSRIRAAMKSTQFEESAPVAVRSEPLMSVCRLYPPVSGSRAEMLSGSETEIAARLVDILADERTGEMIAKNVLVLAEIHRDTLADVTLELLAAARALASATGGQVLVLVLGPNGARARTGAQCGGPNRGCRRSAIGRLFAGALSGRPPGSGRRGATAGRAPRRYVDRMGLGSVAFRTHRRPAGDRLQGASGQWRRTSGHGVLLRRQDDGREPRGAGAGDLDDVAGQFSPRRSAGAGQAGATQTLRAT